jgi:hypothetical protein
MHVLDGGDPVLPHPRVVGISDTVLLADLPDLGGNIWVPRRRHAGEQVVLDLKIEASSSASRNKSTVSGTGLDLTLEPTDLLTVLAVILGGVTVDVFKVVRQGKENGKRQG